MEVGEGKGREEGKRIGTRAKGGQLKGRRGGSKAGGRRYKAERNGTGGSRGGGGRMEQGRWKRDAREQETGSRKPREETRRTCKTRTGSSCVPLLSSCEGTRRGDNNHLETSRVAVLGSLPCRWCLPLLPSKGPVTAAESRKTSRGMGAEGAGGANGPCTGVLTAPEIDSA